MSSAAGPALLDWPLTVLARLRLCIASLTRTVSDSTLSSDGRREAEEGDEAEEETAAVSPAGEPPPDADDVRSRRERTWCCHAMRFAGMQDSLADAEAAAWRTDMRMCWLCTDRSARNTPGLAM